MEQRIHRTCPSKSSDRRLAGLSIPSFWYLTDVPVYWLHLQPHKTETMIVSKQPDQTWTASIAYLFRDNLHIPPICSESEATVYTPVESVKKKSKKQARHSATRHVHTGPPHIVLHFSHACHYIISEETQGKKAFGERKSSVGGNSIVIISGISVTYMSVPLYRGSRDLHN